MQTHWSAHLTLSIVHFMAFPETSTGDGPIVETVREIADDEFFGGIELSWINDPSVRKQVRSIIEVAHVASAFGAHPTLLTRKLDLNSSDAALRARAVAQLKADLDQAAELGMGRLVTLSGWDPGESRRPDAAAWLAESLHEACEYGRRYGIGITLETFDRTVEKKALIGPAGEAAAFSALMRQDYADFGLLYDLGHQPLLDEGILPALRAVQDHLVHAHVGNCVKTPGRASYGDQHPRFGFPGGVNDTDQLVEFLRGLFEIGYLSREPAGSRPWVGIEVKPQPGESSQDVIASSKRVWAEAWARV